MRKTTVKEIQEFIRLLQDFENQGRATSPAFWKPFHFAMLALRSKQLGLQNLSLPDDQESYAVRMGLWDAIGLRPPSSTGRLPSSGRFSEARSIQSEQDVSSVSEELQQVVKNNCDGDAESLDSVAIVLNELLGNCFSHAEPKSNIYGLTCAQSWPRGNLAQIAVVDSGRGIRSTLQENFALVQELERGNACEIATRYEATGKPESKYGHSGYGLTLAKDILGLNCGNLIIASFGEIFQFCDGKQTVFESSFCWEGTIVIFEWNTNRRLDSKAVYDSWPTPEGINDDDFVDFF